MKLPHTIFALLLLSCAAYTSAQTIKPGLWEITSSVMGGSGEMASAMTEAQKQLQSMPPEQRKMMQDMMAKQGVQMGTGAGGGMHVKLCMTQEMIDRGEISRHEGDCTSTQGPRSGNTMKFSFVCTKPPGSGEGLVTFTGTEAYSVKMTTSSTLQGKPQKVDMQSSGRWLGKDCGSVKPIAMPKK